jgi:chitin disaccharide deacetylase
MPLKILICFCFLCFYGFSQETTYAEKLGYPKGAKVLILHVDDVGMSFDSNQGAIKTIENGVANSLSMMMPCTWIPGFFEYLKVHPETDAGLHLTLTSEWKAYRWGPLMGKPAVPGLVDSQGAMWSTVAATATNATADEIEKEIRAQLNRSRAMGWEPTHMDSHMGYIVCYTSFFRTLFESRHDGKNTPNVSWRAYSMIMKTTVSSGLTMDMTTAVGKQLWAAGLPVLDDLHNVSYGWGCPAGKTNCTEKELIKFKTQKYIESIEELKPGLTMVIMHCTWPSEIFNEITDSGTIRKGDALVMLDPSFEAYLQKRNIILTTWRELKKRRDAIK